MLENNSNHPSPKPRVFVLDRHGEPITPTTLRRAHRLMKSGRAKRFRSEPFTIKILDLSAKDVVVEPLVVKLDPGSHTTGVAVVRLVSPEASPSPAGDSSDPLPGDVPSGTVAGSPEDSYAPSGDSSDLLPGDVPNGTVADSFPRPAWDVRQIVVTLVHLVHRARQIHLAMIARSQHRRFRRSRLRFRAPRFNNRRRPEGWLPPSRRHLVDSVVALVKKLMRLAPIRWIIIEDVKFDIQALADPGVSGVEYQRGELYRLHKKEYLLDKHDHKCVYCGATGTPLEVDHVVPRSKGGSDRVSNLVVACVECNRKKGADDLEVFLSGKPALVKKIKASLKKPLPDAAAMNSTRKALRKRLEGLGLPVIGVSPAETKFNRKALGVDKDHAVDAACAGPLSDIRGCDSEILEIRSIGRGQRRRELSDKFGFPRSPRAILPKHKKLFGSVTGDLVMATVTRGANKGVHVGRVTVQSSGQFYMRKAGKIIRFSYKNTKLLQRGDGYAYSRLVPSLNKKRKGHGVDPKTP